MTEFYYTFLEVEFEIYVINCCKDHLNTSLVTDETNLFTDMKHKVSVTLTSATHGH